MRLSWTMSQYLATQFLRGLGLVAAAVFAVAFLIDFVQILGRAAGRDEVSFLTVIGLTALKSPSVLEQTLPFVILFGALWSFTRLTRTQELVVCRASGVSAWQFLTPALGVALLGGLLIVAVFNPIAATLAANFERLEARAFGGQKSLLAVGPTGLWLRQGGPSGQSVIHAAQVSEQGLRLEGVLVLLYDGANAFTSRIDAQSAMLQDGSWELSQAQVTNADQTSDYYPVLKLPTSLTLAQIQESFASPETISVWDLPRFIATAEGAGFSALSHRLHLNQMLASPLLLCAMVLIAATVSLRLSRLGGSAALVVAGVLIGFLLFFATDVASAFGKSGALPVGLAAWGPPLVALLLGAASLLYTEDG